MSQRSDCSRIFKSDARTRYGYSSFKRWVFTIADLCRQDVVDETTEKTRLALKKLTEG